MSKSPEAAIWITVATLWEEQIAEVVRWLKHLGKLHQKNMKKKRRSQESGY